MASLRAVSAMDVRCVSCEQMSAALMPAVHSKAAMTVRTPFKAMLIAVLVLGACGRASHGDDSVVLTVASVIDGDTIVVAFDDHHEQVRLLGIDTPETVDPARPVQCFGPEATARLAELLPPGTAIVLERDAEPRDRYGRLLGYVFRSDDHLFVNEHMLAEGLADVSIYAPNQAYEPALKHAATTARTANVGLWAACGGADVPLQPWEYEP